MKRSLGAKTLALPSPTWVIGTYDKDGKPNVATIAWGGICSSKPPCVSISLRKATYSHGNITLKKAFTVNIPSEKFIKEADHFGIVSGRDKNKFLESGLTPEKSDKVDAPYVKEFPLILECKLIQTHEIGMHTQFIGEIIDVKADESVLGEDGMPDILKVKPFVFSPGQGEYFGIGKLLGEAYTIGKKL